MNTPAPQRAEFQQVIQEKSQNFVGRTFIFTGITNFLHQHNRGYFTIIGAPGSGKSAILANYVQNNSDVIYYNASIAGKNRVEEFLKSVCTQLIERLDNSSSTLLQPSLKARKEQDPSFSQSTEELRGFPDNATEGSWFLSLLLQKISDNLQPNQRLIIAIDALDSVDSNSQPLGTNLFYLPRYLPERIYFILTRRPYNREKSGLLLETPSQTLNLAEYPEQNRQDVQAYIHQNLILLAEERLHISKEEFCDRITTFRENNFMYASQIVSAIAENLYPEPFSHHQLPSGLEAYYQQHWQKMQGNGLSPVALRVLKILVQHLKPISVEDIAEIIDEDEYDVEEVLEDWTEFLTQQQADGKTYYSLYHGNFRDWLVQKTR